MQNKVHENESTTFDVVLNLPNGKKVVINSEAFVDLLEECPHSETSDEIAWRMQRAMDGAMLSLNPNDIDGASLIDDYDFLMRIRNFLLNLKWKITEPEAEKGEPTDE